MEFTKMQGAGNDFIVLDNRPADGVSPYTPEALSALARTLCPRRVGVGADGLMAVEMPAGDGDFRMRFFNADGSPGEMCGNGARCIARFAFDHGIAGAEMCIETAAGPVTATRLREDLYRIRLNPVTKLTMDLRLTALGESRRCDYVELGDPGLPHLTVAYPYLADAEPAALRALGRALRCHPDLPKGANVNFYDRQDGAGIWERTFERGVEDLTWACGTGTAAVVAVLAARGLAPCDVPVEVRMPGGRLSVMLRQEADGQIPYLQGPAETVYVGRL